MVCEKLKYNDDFKKNILDNYDKYIDFFNIELLLIYGLL